MTAVLQVATPEGESGRILSSAGDYLFRYREEAKAPAAISLLMPVRLDEYRHRELHPIFQTNLPEGYVLEQLRNRLAKVVNVDPMLLLALSGSSSPIGRVAVSSHEVDRPEIPAWSVVRVTGAGQGVPVHQAGWFRARGVRGAVPRQPASAARVRGVVPWHHRCGGGVSARSGERGAAAQRGSSDLLAQPSERKPRAKPGGQGVDPAPQGGPGVGGRAHVGPHHRGRRGHYVIRGAGAALTAGGLGPFFCFTLTPAPKLDGVRRSSIQQVYQGVTSIQHMPVLSETRPGSPSDGS